MYEAAFGFDNLFFKVFFEFVFLVDIALQFFTERVTLDTDVPERRLKVIAELYFKDRFVWDLIPLVPL